MPILSAMYHSLFIINLFSYHVFICLFISLCTSPADLTNFTLPDINGSWCYNCFDANAGQSSCRGAINLLEYQLKLRALTEAELAMFSGYGVQRCDQWRPYCVIIDIHDPGWSSQKLDTS